LGKKVLEVPLLVFEAAQRLRPIFVKCPISAGRLLTSAHGAEPKPGAGARAGLQRCRTAVAGCTAENHPGAPKGNRNAFKHGRYSAEAIANRREIAALLREMRATARDVLE
jgi:flavin-dependent dehydrogenase